jgi:hypothetical protein
MTKSVGWQIDSMEKLSLFGKMTLDSRQVNALPASIRERIFKGYSDVLNRTAKSNTTLISFAAETTADGKIVVSYDGGATVEQAALKEFPELLAAMRDAYDVARIQFPTAFQDPKPIEMMPIPSPPEPGSGLGEVRGVGLDVNSAFRNSFSAVGIFGTFVAFSGIVSGILNTWTGGEIALREKGKYEKASAIGDEEGKTKAGLSGVGGGVHGMMGIGILGAFLPFAYDILPGVSASPNFFEAGQYFGFIADGLSIGLSVLMAASAIYEFRFVGEFRSELGRILERDISQQKKATEGLEFLQQQLSLTAKDWGDLLDRGVAQDPQAIKNKCQEKYERFVRRVGAEVAQRVFKESAGLLDGVKEGDLDALKKAKELIELADQESFKKRVSNITILVIATLMTAASIVSIISMATPFGVPVASILFAVNACFWLTIDSKWLHNQIGGAVYKLFKPNEEERWVNNVESREFLEKILEVFLKDGQWDLAQIRHDVSRELYGAKFHLNGKSFTKFEDLLEELGLEDIDFPGPGLDSQTKLDDKDLNTKQRKGLQFLAMLNQGIMPYLIEEITNNNNDVHVFQERGDPFILEANYNKDKGIGTIRARKLLAIKKDPEDTIYPIVEGIIEVDGSHRIWTRTA